MRRTQLRRRCSSCGGESDGRALCIACRTRRRADATSSTRAPWTLSLELKPWQQAALEAWDKADRRGVIEAATGTGKTAVALGAIERLRSTFGSRLRVAIVVPTKVLARQWRDQLEGRLGIRHAEIGEQHSDVASEWRSGHPVLVTVINSARSRLNPVLDHWRSHGTKVLLVVDECHRAGSEMNAAIFDGHYDFALGLSATPERDDWGHEIYVYEGLGRPVYRYPLLDALDDGVLAPLRSINLYVDFAADEQVRWQRLTEDLGSAIQSLMNFEPRLASVPDEFFWREVKRLADQELPAAQRIVKLVAERKELLSTARARMACQTAILDWLAATGHRSIVFHETIPAATASHEYLKQLAVRSGIDHSQLDRATRESAMDGFRSERLQVLVAVRALDEGVDVPDASVAVIAAGSRSRRQRIQRFGRVLRPAAGKEAIVLSILVRGTPEEVAVGGRDASLVGVHRVQHHRWPGTPISNATIGDASSYNPSKPEYTMEDLLTLTELGVWDSTMGTVTRPRPGQPGGYQSVETEFAVNRWHPVDEVIAASGMPVDEFRRIWAAIRPVYLRGLDSEHAADPSVVHGTEVQAIRRRWHDDERRRFKLGRYR